MQAIFFDLDDTLSDHIHSCKSGLSAIRETYTELQQKTVDQLEQGFNELLDIMYVDVLAGRMTIQESRIERIRRVCAACGMHLTPEEAAAVSAEYQAAYMTSRQAPEGTHEVLTWLREQGCKIVVITNGFDAVQTDKIAACGLEPYIDMLITSESIGVTKPNPQIFRTALERLGLTAEQAVMVGDSWSSDIMGAHGVGMRSVWYNRRLAPLAATDITTEMRAMTELRDILAPLLKGDQ